MNKHIDNFNKESLSLELAYKELQMKYAKLLALELSEVLPEDCEYFEWTQYIPTFNDVEECLFTTTLKYPVIKFKNVDEEDHNRDFIKDQSNLNKCKDIIIAIKSIGDDNLEKVFGTPKIIRLYKCGKISIDIIEDDDYN